VKVRKPGKLIIGDPEERDFSQKPVKDTAYLFGPFVGELSWEAYRFAPHVIYFARRNPKVVIIVFTRPERFDLYGSYADILVPLKVGNLNQECFGLRRLSIKEYKWNAMRFRGKYSRRFDVALHRYPDISGDRYKLKWQFSRYKMSYKFNPRVENEVVVSDFVEKLRKRIIVVDTSWVRKVGEKEKILNRLTNLLGKYAFFVYDGELSYERSGVFFPVRDFPLSKPKVTLLGCMISLLRKSFATIGNVSSPISHLSLLLKVPLLTLQEKLDNDGVNLLNPLRTQVTRVEDINSLEERLKKL